MEDTWPGRLCWRRRDRSGDRQGRAPAPRLHPGPGTRAAAREAGRITAADDSRFIAGSSKAINSAAIAEKNRAPIAFPRERSCREVDTTIRSNIGDFWRASVNPSTPFRIFVIKPGQTKTINVSITPSGAAGTNVSGHLYVDELIDDVPPYGQAAGDELAALPYSYTIK